MVVAYSAATGSSLSAKLSTVRNNAGASPLPAGAAAAASAMARFFMLAMFSAGLVGHGFAHGLDDPLLAHPAEVAGGGRQSVVAAHDLPKPRARWPSG